MKNKAYPVIGVTLDWRSSGHYSIYPWYAMRQNYCDCLAQEGALPVLMPYHRDRVEAYLDQIDALLVTGGDFDVHPSLYGEDIKHERVATLEDRTYFEYDLVKSALARDMPILGICGGHQLLNVALGGTLIQHIPAEVETHIAHEQPNPRNEAGHEVDIEPGTQLEAIISKQRISVNSAHHQAIKKTGEGVVVNACAPDGIIEGIEVPGLAFCMGMQWHPEFLITSSDGLIFRSFVEAAKKYNGSK